MRRNLPKDNLLASCKTAFDYILKVCRGSFYIETNINFWLVLYGIRLIIDSRGSFVYNFYTWGTKIERTKTR